MEREQEEDVEKLVGVGYSCTAPISEVSGGVYLAFVRRLAFSYFLASLEP